MCNRGGFATFPTSSALYTYDFQLFRPPSLPEALMSDSAHNEMDDAAGRTGRWSDDAAGDGPAGRSAGASPSANGAADPLVPQLLRESGPWRRASERTAQR